MNSLKKTTCRVLAISVLALSFQGAQAGLIGAGDALDDARTGERAAVMAALDRGDVATQLQAAGVDPGEARARVAAMSDQEVHAMVQDIQTAPAGATLHTAGWLGIIAVAGLVWYFVLRR